MLKERPYELNQKLKRIQASRDNLKENNREKMLQNKTIRDRNAEIAQSRDMWKSRSKDLVKVLVDQKEELTCKIEAANKAMEDEKKRERADILQEEIEKIKKKVTILKA